jgi:DNA-binding NarL/FixJ family response regulator
LRLLIADDNEIVRIGVRALLRERTDWETCGFAASGREAIAKVRELLPDVVILDLTMPDMIGFEVAAEISRIAPATKIVFFSIHDFPVDAIEVGAAAFVSKTAPAKELVATVERVTASPNGPAPEETLNDSPKSLCI